MTALNLSPRWTKLLRDLKAEKERVLLMLVAIAVSLAAVGAVLGGYAVLSREMAANYLGTHPASATLELPGGVDGEALSLARLQPGVREAEARDVLLARTQIGEDWRPLLLFVVDDVSTMKVNTFKPLKGAWPPPLGTMLIERTAPSMFGADVGGHVKVKTAHGTLKTMPISGSVHDPGLAPAWQERTGYGYITRDTLQTLGEEPVLHELRISLDPAADIKSIEATASELARSLTTRGKAVHEIRVPPPRQHPHQKQMTTILFLMLAFSMMTLVLSAILVASLLAAMLARQVREIGVMKTIGARQGQIALLYAALVVAIGVSAIILAIPSGLAGAGVLARAVANLLNFTITNATVPAWVFSIQAMAGILVPLSAAYVPIRRASRLTVREAMDQYGVSPESLRVRTARFPWALRNALRRPTRLALTLGLLAAGGAMFMTALNVSQSWERNIAKVYETRFYDVEVRFHEPQTDRIINRVKEVPWVRSVEAWGYSPSAFSRPGEVDVVRTYPDRGHASFAMMAPPANTKLVAFPLRSGRWLQPGDTDAMVFNHAAAAMRPNLRVGDRVDLSLEGKQTSWRLVGIVEEIGAAGVAYVTDQAFMRVAGTEGKARMLRVATTAGTPEFRTSVIRSIERRLAEDGAGVETTWPLAELRTAMGDHIVILIRSLIAMAAVMAIVGALGLSATMGVSVLERTREFGIMKTLGATPNRIKHLVIAEAAFIGALSWIAALALSIPLTAWLDRLIGNLGFVAPLPFIVAPAAILTWLVLIGLVSLVATLVPSSRASRTSVIQALAQV
ncbi:MAG: FtsX-like permease family protein [Acidobacteria bacterium]|nr:FtsX-like permease family protein [Acidobacteriota bacterium]MBI3487161.1 FtsX-like permease family protein [Acidobacteriota bacterium]